MMNDIWRRRRTQVYLFLIALKRRMTVGARVVLIDGERIFLIRHTYTPGWQFPGGGVEPGESAGQGAAREAMEEAGYRVTERPELFGLYHNVRVTNRDHVALYLCREFEQARPFKPNFEIAEAGWFDHRTLPPDTHESVRLRVAEIFDGVERRETW